MGNIIAPGNVKIFSGNDQERATRCMQNLQVILEQYDCELHPLVTLAPAGNEFGFKVIPKPRTNKQGKSNGLKNPPGNIKGNDGKALYKHQDDTEIQAYQDSAEEAGR